MRILGITSEHIKRIDLVEISPDKDGNLVIIAGDNDQGKSSLVDSISWALESTKKIQAEPIKQGWDSARIRVELGTQQTEIIVNRTFARKEEGGYTTKLKVTRANGDVVSEPQTMLTGLVGALSFDPEEFARAKPEEQFKLLARFVQGIDFDEIKRRRQEVFDRRTGIGRLADEARAAAKAVALPAQIPAAAPDVEKLNVRLAGAAESNAKLEERKRRRADVLRAADDMREQGNEKAEKAQELRAEADRLEAESRELLERSASERKRVADAKALAEPEDTRSLLAQIEEARGIERVLEQVAQRDKHNKSADDLDAQYKELTADINKIDAERDGAIAASAMPVKGLGFGDGIVTFNGVPFKQSASKDQLLISARIAMALNPELKVLLIRAGSLIGKGALDGFGELLKQEGYQCWMERVDTSGEVGFIMEDGRARAAGTTAATPKPAESVADISGSAKAATAALAATTGAAGAPKPGARAKAALEAAQRQAGAAPPPAAAAAPAKPAAPPVQQELGEDDL